MSKVMACSKPASRAAAKPPAAPPAGPERTVRTASAPAEAALIEPPLDCMMRRRGARSAREARDASRPARYSVMIGER